jgi:hypothetical protein
VRDHVHLSFVPSLSNFSQGSDLDWSGNEHFGKHSSECAIKYMYGFELAGVEPGTPIPHRLHDLGETAAFAERYEITGLLESVNKVANQALVESLRDEYKLKKFLSIGTTFFFG